MFRTPPFNHQPSVYTKRKQRTEVSTHTLKYITAFNQITMDDYGQIMLTVSIDSLAGKSGDWTSEGSLLYKACSTCSYNDPFVVALLKGRVSQQTLWPISNPFIEPHTVRDHKQQESQNTHKMHLCLRSFAQSGIELWVGYKNRTIALTITTKSQHLHVMLHRYKDTW